MALIDAVHPLPQRYDLPVLNDMAVYFSFQIYSSARSFLRNSSEGQIIHDVEQSALSEQFENQDKANISTKYEYHSEYLIY